MDDRRRHHLGQMTAKSRPLSLGLPWLASRQRRAASSARPVYRATQRKPMWLVEVSIAPGWRAAGR